MPDERLPEQYARQLVEMTVRQDEQIRTLFGQTREIRDEIKGLREITGSIQSLAQSVKILSEDLRDMKNDLIEIKKEPASAWKNFKWMLVGVLATGIGGSIIAALFALIAY